MKKTRLSLVMFLLAAMAVGILSGCATDGGQVSSGAAQEQPALREQVDKIGSGANRPTWENK